MWFKTDKNLRFFFTFGNLNNQREQNNTQKLFLLPNKKLKKTNQSLNAKKKKNAVLLQHLFFLVICHIYGQWVQSLDSFREMMREAEQRK